MLLCSLSRCAVSQDGGRRVDPACPSDRSKQFCYVEQAVTAPEDVECLGRLVDEE